MVQPGRWQPMLERSGADVSDSQAVPIVTTKIGEKIFPGQSAPIDKRGHRAGGRTTSLSKQSLRTCNVDNELRQGLVLLRCPPILANWRTTINTELAHYPRGRRGKQTLRSVNSILTVSTRFFQDLSHRHRLPKHLAGNLSNGNQFSATNDALAQQDGAHDAVVRTHSDAYARLRRGQRHGDDERYHWWQRREE